MEIHEDDHGSGPEPVLTSRFGGMPDEFPGSWAAFQAAKAAALEHVQRVEPPDARGRQTAG